MLMIFLDPTSDIAFKKIQDLLDALEQNKTELEAYDRYLDEIRSQAAKIEFAEEKGETKRALEIAQQLLNLNILDIATIAQTTGLTIEQVKELKKNKIS